MGLQATRRVGSSAGWPAIALRAAGSDGRGRPCVSPACMWRCCCSRLVGLPGRAAGRACSYRGTRHGMRRRPPQQEQHADSALFALCCPALQMVLGHGPARSGGGVMGNRICTCLVRVPAHSVSLFLHTANRAPHSYARCGVWWRWLTCSDRFGACMPFPHAHCHIQHTAYARLGQGARSLSATSSAALCVQRCLALLHGRVGMRTAYGQACAPASVAFCCLQPLRHHAQ